MKHTKQPSKRNGGNARPAADSTPGMNPNEEQPVDTRSGDSDTDSGTAAKRAMKQTSKTAAENNR